MKAEDIRNVPAEKFRFVQKEAYLHDEKFTTRPIGYLEDAWLRFRRNKGSVVAAVIIVLLLIYAIVVPLVSQYDVKYRDDYYQYTVPKSDFFSKLGFWNGYKKITCNQQGYDYYQACGAVVKTVRTYTDKTNIKRYEIELDTYRKPGFVYKRVTPAELRQITAYEAENGVTLLSPIISTDEIKLTSNQTDANFWFAHDLKGRAETDENGDFIPIYLTSDVTNTADEATAEGVNLAYDGSVYAKALNGGAQYEIRVYYYDYYQFLNGFEPEFVFGTDGYGQDIFVRLASGARLSFLLSFCVAIINFIIGTIYGAVEGYYGGAVDMILERISDILSGVPFIIVATLFQMHLSRKVGVIGSLIFAFVLTGWLGTAYRVRTQFYRFKGQEYVLAARTLGAKDPRIIFHHIFPNALGTIITSSVLMIPSVIFTESMLSFLGIVDLQTTNMTSVGTLLSNGQKALSTYPHAIFFPALFISLLMISFNIFGNGLRDAFNPSLRGVDE